MKKGLLFLTIVFFTFFFNQSNAQFKNYKIKGGAKYQHLIPLSEFKSAFSFAGRGYVGFELTNTLCLELGLGYGQYKTDDDFNPNSGSSERYVKADIIPIDARLRISPWARTAVDWNPYFYIGAGVMNYKVKETPGTTVSPQYNELHKGWVGTLPAGIGTEIKLGKNVLMDVAAGFTYTTTDLLNNFVITDFKDCSINLDLGFTFTGNDDCNTDEDKDGLTKCKEQQIGTNPVIADTDGDGLKDGDEVNQYKTNPLLKDTDGEGLNDGEEVMTYNTNPLNRDTDNDRLNDYEEVKTYSTLPNDSDTDDDGLSDGDEVLTYKTNPKLKDTDHGSIDDGVEVGRGTNPLDPSDDLPKEEPMKVGTVIILEGINFASGSYEISSGSESILEQAYNTMKNNPEIVVEISGHTDSRGGRAMNMELSKNRAESVKAWLVSKGIDGSRIETKGYGPDQPIDSNDTEAGRYKNRRIEFKRIK